MTAPIRTGRDSTNDSPATHTVFATNLSPSNQWPFRYSVAGAPLPCGRRVAGGETETEEEQRVLGARLGPVFRSGARVP